MDEDLGFCSEISRNSLHSVSILKSLKDDLSRTILFYALAIAGISIPVIVSQRSLTMLIVATEGKTSRIFRKDRGPLYRTEQRVNRRKWNI